MTTPTLVTVNGAVNPLLEATNVTFRIPTMLRYSNGPSVILPGDQLTVPVPSNGVFTLPIYGTNDPLWSPVNWTYKVLITGDNLHLEYLASVPYDAGTIDFSDILPAQASSNGTLYAAYSHGNHVLVLAVGAPVPVGTPNDTLIVRI
jgi:hypothetical protein